MSPHRHRVACALQAMLRQQEELAQLVADFEATQALSEAALARLARGDPGGHLARLQVCVHAAHCLFRPVSSSECNDKYSPHLLYSNVCYYIVRVSDIS